MTTPKSRKMALDFHGLLQILAENLYNEKDVFVRELIQNSHDACWRRHYRDTSFDFAHARVDILSDLSEEAGRVIFRDNGEGMTEQNLIDFLSSIGDSGTKAAKQEDSRIKEAIGQFGIGFLSGFVVGKEIEVRTRHFTASPDEALLWKSSGEQDYTIEKTNKQNIGTEVTITLKDASVRGVVSEDAIKKTIRHYADLLPLPIYINRANAPANRIDMPWEKFSGNELELENRLFLDKRVPDHILEVIPVELERTQGLLYLTKTRVIGQDAPRTMQVFLKRMHLCDNAVGLLPSWATFVNGIINTESLAPNAARDNYMRDDESIRLCETLGDVVIRHLEKLQKSDSSRLSEILDYHELGIKAACHYHDEFYKKFAGLLEWRINSEARLPIDILNRQNQYLRDQDNAIRVTLPDLVAVLPEPEQGGPKRLSYFTSRSATTQFFEMANAANTIVLDASQGFEEELLKEWAKQHDSEVTLVRLGQVNDPALFGELDMSKDTYVSRLAELMSRYVQPGGARLEVTARHIKPENIAAILRDEEQVASLQKARSLLTDANTSAEMKRMAEDMLKMARRSDMKMVINASNPLVRGLAKMCEHTNPNDTEQFGELQELMTGLYNSAMLSNQQMLTPSNAKIFHEQYQRLMASIIDNHGTVGTLQRKNNDLMLQLQTYRPLKEDKPKQHLQGFYVTPFDDKFNQVREAMKKLFNEQFGCQLIDAEGRTFNGHIHENVKAHIQQADFFVIDITGVEPGQMNPNVMIELGAINMSRPDAPCLVIAAVEDKDDKFILPTDINGLIHHTYVAGDDNTSWRAVWSQAVSVDDTFSEMFNSRPDVAITTQIIRNCSKGLINDEARLTKLVTALPTQSNWRNVTEEQLSALIDDEMLGALAQPLKAKIIALGGYNNDNSV